MYHSGKDYQIVDRMALKLRIDYGHFDKHLDVFKLARQLNMVLIKYSSLTNEQLKTILGYDELKDGFAQNLANKLGVAVSAPTKLLWSDARGNHFVAGINKYNPLLPSYVDMGEFITYYPGGNR